MKGSNQLPLALAAQVPAVWARYEIYDAPEPQTDSLIFGSLITVYQLPSPGLVHWLAGYFYQHVYSEDAFYEVAIVL